MFKEKIRKPVETVMFWWLNTNRPFYIGDEYRIDLVSSNRFGTSIKIVVTNLKTMPDQFPEEKMYHKPSSLRDQADIDQEIKTLESLIKGHLK